MVKNSPYLTSFRVTMVRNINAIWMPLCWLVEDLLVWNKSFLFILSGKLQLNAKDVWAKQYGASLSDIKGFVIHAKDGQI